MLSVEQIHPLKLQPLDTRPHSNLLARIEDGSLIHRHKLPQSRNAVFQRTQRVREESIAGVHSGIRPKHTGELHGRIPFQLPELHSLNCAPPIHGTTHTKNLRRHRRSPNALRGTAVGSPPQLASAPTLANCDRLAPFQGPAISKTRSPVQNFNSYMLPVSPFVVTLPPAPPDATSTTSHCLAGKIAQAESPLPRRNHLTFYSGHTPTLWLLKHLDDSCPGTGNQPATTELPALVITSTLRFTSLSRAKREGRWPYVGLPKPTQFAS